MPLKLLIGFDGLLVWKNLVYRGNQSARSSQIQSVIDAIRPVITLLAKKRLLLPAQNPQQAPCQHTSIQKFRPNLPS